MIEIIVIHEKYSRGSPSDYTAGQCKSSFTFPRNCCLQAVKCDEVVALNEKILANYVRPHPVGCPSHLPRRQQYAVSS